MRPKKRTFQSRTGEKEANLTLPLKITETIGSGFPNFVLGILLADSTITRSMTLSGQRTSFSNEVEEARALDPGRAARERKQGMTCPTKREGEEAVGGSLTDYLLKVTCKLISQRPSLRSAAGTHLRIREMWKWKGQKPAKNNHGQQMKLELTNVDKSGDY